MCIFVCCSNQLPHLVILYQTANPFLYFIKEEEKGGVH